MSLMHPYSRSWKAKCPRCSTVWTEVDYPCPNCGKGMLKASAASANGYIHEAEVLIDRLQRRYLNGNGHAQPRRPLEQPHRSTAQ
jgi:hypothetical protein